MADADDLLLPLSRSLPCVTASATPAEGKDAHWCRDELPPLPPDARLVFEQGPCARAHYSARLLTMRDGTRVAVDVMLPEVRTELQQCSVLSSEQPSAGQEWSAGLRVCAGALRARVAHPVALQASVGR